jgi:hypothetical protein
VERITQINHGDHATQIAVLNINPVLCTRGRTRVAPEPTGWHAALATLLTIWISVAAPWGYVTSDGVSHLIGPVSYTALFFLSYVTVMALLYTMIISPCLLRMRVRP